MGHYSTVEPGSKRPEFKRRKGCDQNFYVLKPGFKRKIFEENLCEAREKLVIFTPETCEVERFQAMVCTGNMSIKAL